MAEGSELATAALRASLERVSTPDELNQNSTRRLQQAQGRCCTCTNTAKCQTRRCLCFQHGRSCTACPSKNCCNNSNQRATDSNSQNNGRLSACSVSTAPTSAFSSSLPTANLSPIASTPSSRVFDDPLFTPESLSPIDKQLCHVSDTTSHLAKLAAASLNSLQRT